MSGAPRSSRWVDSPMSRLSKRTTNSPRSTSPEQNSSGQPIICVASPMMSSTGGFARPGAELVGPADHLRGQPHDEQHRRVVAVAERLVGELDVPDLRALDAVV